MSFASWKLTNAKETQMISRKFSAKILFTCVTLFAMHSFAVDSMADAQNQPESTQLSQLKTPDVRRNDGKVRARQEGSLILDNAQSKNLKDFQKFSKTEGPRTGGGGNSCALSIYQNTEKLVSLIHEMPTLLNGQLRGYLLHKISVAKFYISENLILDGQVKDAINYPDTNEIYLSNRLCGLDLLEVQGRAMAILLHEYLGLANIDDRRYQVSGAFLQNYSTYRARGYTFIADNSYLAHTGECVQSVLQIQVIGNNFVISSSSKPGARVLPLMSQQVEDFFELGNRVWGPTKTVVVADRDAGVEYVFSSEACNSIKCEYLRIRKGNETLKTIKSSINGLSSIGCK
ncbi:hypothetical protein ACLVWU_00500 [Bdellovibrio sp. HCB290]|uniref:hypothetical protein n=1 Tax=Bdellovibrio sp. HCB290 TaxID=3394356 RepID=UPI0039B5798E